MKRKNNKQLIEELCSKIKLLILEHDHELKLLKEGHQREVAKIRQSFSKVIKYFQNEQS